MDHDLRADLDALRAHLGAVERGQAWPKVFSVLALLAAVGALLLPATCR